MSIASEIERISGNVQSTIDTIRATGVTAPEGANSDDLPSLAQALATTKQDKLTGTAGQVVGFNETGAAIPVENPVDPESLILKGSLLKLPESEYWTDILYADNKYLAVCRDVGNVYISTDLKNWAEHTVDSTAALNNVVYGNGVFVVTDHYGNENPVHYSSDGENWQAADMDRMSYFPCTAAFGAGKFVAIAASESSSGRDAFYSEDGHTWTRVANALPETNFWYQFNFLNDRFIAVSRDLSNISKIAYSLDGITWQNATLPPEVSSTALTNAAYGNGKYVVLEKNKFAFDINWVLTSNDGINWTSQRLSTSDYSLIADWASLAFGNGKFVSIAKKDDTSLVIYSEDGINWNKVVIPFSYNWKKLVWDGSRFIAIASASDAMIVSSDGIHWTDEVDKKILNPDGTDVTEEVSEALGVPEKQDKLIGTAGQVVGFDIQGNAIAQDAPESGMTQTEADERYLQMQGTATVPDSIGTAPYSIEFTEETEDAPVLTFGPQSVAATSFTSDTTYEGWGFRAAVLLTGVTADYVPSVTFGIADATGGNLAPVADSYAGGVYIYAKEQPTAAVSIASVVCCKGV